MVSGAITLNNKNSNIVFIRARIKMASKLYLFKFFKQKTLKKIFIKTFTYTDILKLRS